MSEEVADYMSPTALSPGQRLAKIREEQGLTVADVAAKLRLAPRQIAALEAGDFARLPGHATVRGFVKNYARLLQIDQEPLLAEYESIAPGDGSSSIAVPTQNVQFSETLSRHRNRETLWLTLGLVLLTAAAILLWQWEKELRQHFNPVAKPITSQVPAPPVAPPIPVVLPPVADVVESVAPSEPKTGIHFVFDGPSWVEIKDSNGNIVFNKSNLPGTEQDIAVPPPLSFKVGNAAKVKMTYNGEPFDLTPHIKGSMARFTLDR